MHEAAALCQRLLLWNVSGTISYYRVFVLLVPGIISNMPLVAGFYCFRGTISYQRSLLLGGSCTISY